MIGIIGAMEEEVAILKDKLTDMNEISVAHVKFYRGKLNSKRSSVNSKWYWQSKCRYFNYVIN